MEGVSGIVKPEQTSGGDPMYEEGRKLYTEEINAAVRGAKAGGATEIVVMDCHGAGGGWTFNSLVPELLDPDCEWVVQEEWTGYTEFLEQGCDAALFVGMHAMAGTQHGNMNHTVSGRDYQASGSTASRWARPGSTPPSAGRGAARSCSSPATRPPATRGRRCSARADDGRRQVGLGSRRRRGMIPPVRARQLIEEGASKALADLKAVPPYDPGSPCEIKVEFKRTQPADRLRFHPGVERLDGRTIRVEAPTWWDAWKRSSSRREDALRVPRRLHEGGSFVRGVNRKVLTAALAVALAGSFAVGAVHSSPATAAGADATYLVLAPQGNSTAKAAARVAAAGGTVVADYRQIGVLVARSTNPDFATAASGAGVEAVASTTGLGTPLEEDETLQTVGSATQQATGNPTGEPLWACSGT